jgi:Na+/melibiose symporter-like transporter
LRCASDFEIGFLGSSFFVGLVFGTTILARLGDTVGRILMMRVGMLLTIILYAMMVFLSRHLLLTYILIFGIGMLSCFRLNLGFIYG